MIKEALSYKGSINKREYIVSLVIYLVSLVLLIFLFARLSGVFFALVFAVIFIVLHIYLFGKGTKRCHDLGKKGWDQFSVRTWLLMITKDKKAENKVTVE